MESETTIWLIESPVVMVSPFLSFRTGEREAARLWSRPVRNPQDDFFYKTMFCGSGLCKWLNP